MQRRILRASEQPDPHGLSGGSGTVDLWLNMSMNGDVANVINVTSRMLDMGDDRK
jgi:hypothetical protein